MKGHEVDQQLYLPMSDTTSVNLNKRRLGCALDVFAELADVRSLMQEHLVAFDLNARHQVLERRVVHIGSLTGVEVHPREVFRGAVINAAAAMIIAHNHPSGDPTPSRQDIDLTRRLREVGDLLGIAVLDHVVVAADGYISLAERDWR
jgi:DNA repair protein RadC